MRLKKGFTLAEILIVLMVIGVIATLTVPSMMKGVQEAQYKASFKKAYNTVTNLAATLSVEGKMPVLNSTAQANETARFFVAMMESMSVREVTAGTGTNVVGLSSRSVAPRASAVKLSYNIDNNQKTFGSGTAATLPAAWVNNSYWITTDDGISYTLLTGKNCKAKTDLTANTTMTALLNDSCLAIVADVNGLNKTPNYIEPQSDITTTAADMQPLTGDQYYIFVARDGVTAGSKLNNAAARIVADMK